LEPGQHGIHESILSQYGLLCRWIEISELDVKFGGKAAYLIASPAERTIHLTLGPQNPGPVFCL
jgi:hypothetical protein